MVNTKVWTKPKKLKSDDPEYFKKYRQEQRKIEKELGVRYHSWEQAPGESFSDFKKRLTGRTL